MVINTLTEKFFRGVHKRKWNSKYPLVFLAVMLRQVPGVRKYAKICTLLVTQLKVWIEGKYTTLVWNVDERGVNCTPIWWQAEDEYMAWKCNVMVLAGKVRSAVCQATQCAGGRPMDPFEIGTKSGKSEHQVHGTLAPK